LGSVTVTPTDPKKKPDLEAQLHADYGDTIENRACPPDESPNAICVKVSSSYAEGIKKAALSNAVTTIRERIDEKGVAEPSVIEKGDDIIVELPGDPDDPIIGETKDIIARTAKLEFKVVDDGSVYMSTLYAHVAGDKKAGKPADPIAVAEGILADAETW